jgi:predicted metal-dependent hydrolase
LKVIDHPVLGEVVLKKNIRSRNISVRIKAEQINVSLPFFSSYDDAMAFVESKVAEIEKKRAKLVSRKRLFTIENPTRTFSFEMYLVPLPQKDYQRIRKGDKLYITFPGTDNPLTDSAQKIFRGIFEYTLKQEAHKIFPVILKEEAEKHGFSYNSVRISLAHSRWGSCSSGKNINLNIYLLTLPEHLMRYVMLHELCHTEHMDHSKHFYARLNQVSGGKSDEYRKELKVYSIG